MKAFARARGRVPAYDGSGPRVERVRLEVLPSDIPVSGLPAGFYDRLPGSPRVFGGLFLQLGRPPLGGVFREGVAHHGQGRLAVGSSPRFDLDAVDVPAELRVRMLDAVVD